MSNADFQCNNLVWHQGTVVLLDALGTKNMKSRKEIELFIKKLRKLHKESQEYADKYFREFKINYKASVPKYAIFNDTVFIWSEQGEMSQADHLAAIGYFTARFLVEAIRENIYFRGAISNGEFVTCDNPPAVLGNAVNEAAKMYEKADWFGVIMDNKNWSAYKASVHNELLWRRLIFHEYQVPLKCNQTLATGALSWPIPFVNQEDFELKLKAGSCVGVKRDHGKKFFNDFLDEHRSELMEWNEEHKTARFLSPEKFSS